ncbi:MAG: preprotein translocase subunit YajC [Magnetococcales bacterium]|nr:preprotein translocase subunit YajC [Magnetococcales bacterium]MBF0156849.1 preprotein translocase subunit YajC [Magnetococcales bacterium]
MIDWIATAQAQAQGAPQSSTEAAVLNGVLMLVLFAIFYFLLIRPQQKQAKAHREMVDNLQRGDTVVTGGGILGRIHRIDDDLAVVEIGEVEVTNKAFKPVRIRVAKSTITSVKAKAGVPASAPRNDPGEGAEKNTEKKK